MEVCERKLSSYHEAILTFFRNQVDTFEYEAYLVNRNPRAQTSLYLARQQLKSFVEELRRDGYNI